MSISRALWILFILVMAAAAGQWLLVRVGSEPEDLPWTPLDLRARIGAFTGRKLAALRDDPQLCRRLLSEAEIGFSALPPLHQGSACGWSDAVRLTARSRPHVPLACPLAAGLDVWMREIVQPAADDLLHARVTRVEDYGSYACRRISGAHEGSWSEHAYADAIDISGFRLADGSRVTVAMDWQRGRQGLFLHRIHDGACRIFATTLSPEYNAAHRDHLHLDMAARGSFGWSACR